MTRHLAVALVSLAVVVSAGAYALSPASEALGAEVSGVAAQAGMESIKGRVVIGGSGAPRTIVRVIRRVNRRPSVVATARTDARGRFSIRVRPGSYVVELQRGVKSKKSVIAIDVIVKRRSAIYIAAKVTKVSGGLLFSPVIFSY